MNSRFVVRWSGVAALAVFCLSLSAGARAQADRATTEHVSAQLIASVDAVHSGEKILVGVRQRIVPQWHTYWLNPGDTGFRTRIEWTLPQGASAGEIQWPVPSRFTLGAITNYGYEKEVTLLSPVVVPENVKAGDSFPIKAKVSWLVCKDVCIPQHVELALTLPVIRNGQSAAANPEIKKARYALPAASPWPVHANLVKSGLSLRIESTELQSIDKSAIWFYANQPGNVAPGAKQKLRADRDAVILDLKAGDVAATAGERLSGVLAVTEKTQDGNIDRGYLIDTVLNPATNNDVGSNVPLAESEPDLGFMSALVLALMGGIILNLMPCVFPVLSIKALSLLDHAHQTRRQARLHGLTYTLGVLASFALLGGILIVLKAGGAQIGWGFQFQSPSFVLIAAYLMFAVGLSLSGVFSVGASVAGVGSSLAERSGYSGSFFTGVLATIVATPCTAPFMGGALGYALTQPPFELMAVFISLGLGLALPYLLLSNWPLLQRWLPRPGLWMERVKQLLAFPMYGAAAWLVWVLAQQAGINAIAIALGSMVMIAFAAWLFETTRLAKPMIRRSSVVLSSLTVIAVLLAGYAAVNASSADRMGTSISAEDVAEPYSIERLHALRADGKSVFVNFTAAWCITCLVNEKAVLSQRSVLDAFHQSGVTYLKGDWTNQDTQITKQLAEFGRSGVPLYVFYPNGMESEPIVLPQILTPSILMEALKKAPSSRGIAS
jgi:thiol:disulfide interchange protein/DsbC/DsbD-like thiol-disulfide interchange protein